MSVSQSDRAELLASGLFDADWYRETYPDVDQTGLAPLDHYLRIGRHLVRSPGPDFDSARYLSAHEDLARANVDPLQHYIRHGRRENRQAFTRAAPAPVSSGAVMWWASALRPAPASSQ